MSDEYRPQFCTVLIIGAVIREGEDNEEDNVRG
jgi:hypothetical protein